MLIPLIVTISLFVQVCTAQDVSFARLTTNQATKASGYASTAVLFNGDVVVGGFTNGLVGFASAGVLLQRYSPEGSLIWTKVLGGFFFDYIVAIAVDPNDNIYATGCKSSGGSCDVYIGKFDSSGNSLFTAIIGGGDVDVGTSIAVDSVNGVFYVAGYTSSSMFYNVPITSGTGIYDAFLLKLNSTTGAVISNTQRGVAGAHLAYEGMTLDSTGAVWATGYTTAPTYLGMTNKGSFDIVIQKFSPSGTSLFTGLLGGIGQDRGFGIAADVSNNVYVVGGCGNSIDSQPRVGEQDIVLIKYNSAGTKLWTKIFGSAYSETPNDIAVDSALGLIYITGLTWTSDFYGSTAPGTNQKPFLLVLNSTDGSRVSSAIYPASGGHAIANGVAIRGPLVYMAGTSYADFQGQTKPGGTGVSAGFLLKVGDTAATAAPTVLPTVAVTAVPSTVSPTPLPSGAPLLSPTPVPTTSAPTASPTAVCMHWALGDYGESCSTTCSKLSRTCKDKYLKEVVTQEAFYAVVGSAVNSRTGGAVGTAETFCSLTTESVVTVGGPAALSVVLSLEDHHAPVRTSCTHPTSAAEATLGCDDVLPLHNYRRFCPCLDHNCDGAWYLGYSGDSCDATCASAGGVCDAEPLSYIVSSGEFSAMVASATVVETNELIGESAAAFCHEGINILPLAPAPSVITLTFGAVNETLCAYPTNVSNLQGSCDMAFTDLPAQRFCNCRVTGPASHPHRMLLDAAATAVVPEPAAAAQATPRLRGNAFAV